MTVDASSRAGGKVRRGRLLTLGAGALPVVAFPEPSWWWFAWASLVPVILLLAAAPNGREAAVRGWLGGTGFTLGVYHWVAPNAGLFVVPLGFFLGLLWLPWGWAVHALIGPGTGGGSGRRLAAAVTLLPSGWVLIELARSWERLGGPWGLLGATQWNSRATLAPAELGGVWLVSALVVAVNVALAVALAVAVRLRGEPRGAGLRITALGLALVLGLAGPAWSLAGPEPRTTGTVRVAIVQPGTVHRGIERFEAGEEMTRGLRGRGADLVVWGESSVSFDLGARPDLLARLERLSALVGADLLVNVDARRGEGGIFKSSVLVAPDGIAGRYEKMRLVPFGEYVPLRALFEWTTLVTEAADEDRRRGKDLRILRTAGLRVGPLVSFESVFPDMTRNLVRRGADLVVMQSATSTFQQSWAPEQHASFAALRAVESGRPVVHAALTGVSTVFDADGRRLGRLRTSQRDVLLLDVPLASGETLFVRLGNWVPWTSLVMVGGALALAGLNRAMPGAAPIPGPRT